MSRRPPISTLFPSPTLSRSGSGDPPIALAPVIPLAPRRKPLLQPQIPPTAHGRPEPHVQHPPAVGTALLEFDRAILDRKSTRLNSSHANISYAVFCLKKKNL